MPLMFVCPLVDNYLIELWNFNTLLLQFCSMLGGSTKTIFEEEVEGKQKIVHKSS